MKLPSKQWHAAVTDPHNFTRAIGSMCPCTDLKLITQCIRLNHQTVISSGNKRIRNPVKNTAVIVVDLGTAVTFDVVDSQGRYRGGAIAPGLGLSLDALFSQTAKLPRVDLVPPTKAIGRNTSESIQSGVFYGAVAMVDGMVERMRSELGEDPLSVIATGGYAEHVAESSRTIQRVDQDLTLLGLHYLYGLNTPSS